MNPAKDITGQRFGKLTVIGRYTGERFTKGGAAYWVCKCDCGKEHIVSGSNVRRGNVRSCGCVFVDIARKMGKANKGGWNGGGRPAGTGERLYNKERRLYNVCVGMRERCNCKDWPQYKDYGGRGITVCEEWNSFETFMKWAYANGYDKNAKRGECTIDRIDNDKGYSPDNCRWVSMSVQLANRRSWKRNKTA